MKKQIGNTLTAVFLAVFFYYFVSNIDDFKQLSNVGFNSVLLIFSFKLVTIFLNGLFVKSILKTYQKHISVGETSYLSLISTIGNYFLPLRGGAFLRAFYLKTRHNFAYTDFITTLSGNYIITFFISAGTGLLSLMYISRQTGIFPILLYAFLISITLSSLVVMFFQMPVSLLYKEYSIRVINNITNLIGRILTGWNTITSNKGLIIELSIITISSLLIVLATSYILFTTLEINVGIFELLLYSSLTSLSLLVSLTPGSLGIREAMFILFATTLGITNTEILQMAILDRGIAFIMLFVLYIFLKTPYSSKLLGINTSLAQLWEESNKQGN